MASIVVYLERATRLASPARLGPWLLAVWVALLALPAAARELHWRELAVTARLDAEGLLHVSELHRMVFTGDYNGGERSFRVQGDQTLELEGLYRIEAGGREIELSEGDLSSTDQFAWHGAHVLRWRSRASDAPPFDETLLTYRIDYVQGRVLLDDGGGAYTLEHDFAFPDRPGNIELFRLHLEADPAWHQGSGFPLALERQRLEPSESAVVTLALQHADGASSQVSSARRPGAGEPLALRLGLAAVLIGAAFLLVRAARARERVLGRFDPVPATPASPDGLRENLLSLRPELVGALYHEQVGVTEVAALLARLEVEGKIRSSASPGSDGLSLQLLVKRSSLRGYERRLIDKLFVTGKKTNAKLLREHYASDGFHPPGVLSESLEPEMKALLGLGEGGALLGCLCVPGALFAAVCLLIAFLVFVASEAVVEPSWLSSAVLWGHIGFALVGGRLASRSAAAVQGARAAHDRFVAWLVAGTLGMAFVLVAARSLPLLELILLVSLGLCLVLALSWIARTSLGREGVAMRRRLFLARQQLTELLARGERNEAWVPYLVALDMRDGLESMLRGIAPPSRDTDDTTDAATSSQRATADAALWVGGGGRFGGGGASFAWGAAMAELAQGVSAPSESSSSSDTSSSDSGGSSGGGGGGGW